jgi:glycosyltransferase involved in cell wall biosynthesis
MLIKNADTEWLKPDFVFEASWEVCNKVGGIYTVLSTKAKTMKNLYGDNILFVGPLCQPADNNIWFREDNSLLAKWKQNLLDTTGLTVKTGKWQIPGEPTAALVDFSALAPKQNSIFTQMWNHFGVDSLHGYGDYAPSCLFAVAAAMVIENCYRFFHLEQKDVIAHFDEWTLGMGLLYLKTAAPDIATVFTTHATTVGRSIAFNNKPLYDCLTQYNGLQMADQLNVTSKHSVEKAAASNADAFTTVSQITAREAECLLQCQPLVTPNGFENDFVPRAKEYNAQRLLARQKMLLVARQLTGKPFPDDTLLIATAGRYEYRNKGIDLFIDALARTSQCSQQGRTILAFVMVPAWVDSPRRLLQQRLKKTLNNPDALPQPFITHNMVNIECDPAVSQIKYLKLDSPHAPLSLIFVPSYLNGEDGIFDMTYYDLLPGMDATFFPSYYEPWGYTPHESIAFGVPTLTSSLAGFGAWAKTLGDCTSMEQGIMVVERNDHNFIEISEQIARTICRLAVAKPAQLAAMRRNASAKAALGDWKHFFREYEIAYCKALHARQTAKQAPDRQVS